MSLLDEVAVTPDVFTESGYSQSGLCPICLSQLGPALLEEAVVRDLRDGEWRQFAGASNFLHPAGRELLTALIKSSRFVAAPRELAADPTDDMEWGYEAVASHGREPVSAIVMGSELHSSLGPDEPTCCVERLRDSAWWQSRSTSVRLRRVTSDYLHALRTALLFSNSVMFIDPHLDPSRAGYSNFSQILDLVRRREQRPVIEIHRVCYTGGGRDRQLLARRDLESSFAGLDAHLKAAGIPVTVFVWDDAHDRYLISNLVGINTPNGFDTTNDLTRQLTTWTRLSPRDRDSVQREFDPAAGVHRLHYTFGIGQC